jgi:4-amino-4-deoxy-L-arabinose transferase-like glycosyltransferase
LKFSDVVIATASALVIYWLSYAVLSIMFVSVPILHVPAYVSPLIAAVVVGYVFAGKIREESRMRSIGKIVVLFTVLVMLVYSVYFSYMSYTITGHISAWVGDTADIVAIVVVTALFGFVGLYVGSIRKPSAKTKK